MWGRYNMKMHHFWFTMHNQHLLNPTPYKNNGICHVRSHMMWERHSSGLLCSKYHSTFCAFWPHSDMHTWGPSSWAQRTLGNRAQGPSRALAKEQGSYNSVQSMGHKGPILRPRCIGPGRARTQIPFYSIMQLTVVISSTSQHKPEITLTWCVSLPSWWFKALRNV
jgi:hypothetical protein